VRLSRNPFDLILSIGFTLLCVTIGLTILANLNHKPTWFGPFLLIGFAAILVFVAFNVAHIFGQDAYYRLAPDRTEKTEGGS
jgi:hypothetical protein